MNNSSPRITFPSFSFLLASLCLIACFLLFFFWQILLGSLIFNGANQYCLHYFGAPLEIERIYRDPEAKCWIIEKPQIARSDANLKGESLRLDWSLYPFNNETAIRIEVFGSHINIGEETADLSSFFKKLLPKSAPYWFFHLNSQFDLRQGVIAWKSREGKIETAQFEASALSAKEKKTADITLFLDKNLPQQNAFQLQVSQEHDQPFEAILAFHQIDVSKLFRLFETFGNPVGDVLQGWRFLKGNINGSLSVFVPYNGIKNSSTYPFVLGKATFSDFSLEHPQRKINGDIEEFVIDLQIDQLDKKQWKKGLSAFPAVHGSLEIVKEASFFSHRKGSLLWKIEEIKGAVLFEPDQKLSLNLNGKCNSKKEGFLIKIEGEGAWKKAEGLLLHSSLYLETPDRKSSALHLATKPLSLERHQMNFQLSHFGSKEWMLLKNVLCGHSQHWKQIEMQKGFLYASGSALFNRFHIEELKLEKLEAKKLRFVLPSASLNFSAEQILGKGTIDFSSEDFFHGTKADFSLFGGTIGAISPSGSLMHFEDISTEFSFRKGVIQKSEIQGKLGKLQGAITVDWHSKEHLVDCVFSGPAEEIVPFFAPKLQLQAKKALSGDDLLVKAKLFKQGEGAQVKGDIQFFRAGFFRSEEALSFGFHLEKSSQKLWKKWPPDPLAVAYWKRVGKEVLQSVLPPIASPLALFESNWIRSELGVGGFVLRKGWFSAHSVPLEKYLAPFLFRHDEMVLKGVGSFQGDFDSNQLAVSYELNEALLENTYLSLTAEHIVEASHYFNFDKGSQYGSLPLKKGTYLEKASGLCFENLEASVAFVDHQIHLQRVETECKGVSFIGEIDIDFGLPNDGIFDVEVNTSRVKGSLSQLQNLCRSLASQSMPTSELWPLSIPLDGEFALTGDGGKLHFSFSPDECLVEAELTGVIEKGSISLEEVGMQLEDVGLEFSCYFDSDRFQFETSQITALVSSQDLISPKQNYSFIGDNFQFVYARKAGKPHAIFDFWLSDRSRDLVRLVGSALPEGDGLVIKVDPQKTHLGHVHPTDFKLLLNHSFRVEEFRCLCNLSLADLGDSFIPNGGLIVGVLANALSSTFMETKNKQPSLSVRKWSKEMAVFKNAQGKLHLGVTYQGDKEELGYHFKGENLAWKGGKAAFFDLQGSYQKGIWTIDHFIKDTQKMSGSIARLSSSWEIKDWLVQEGQIMRLYLDGSVEDKENRFQGHVHQIEIDLAHLKGTPELDQCMTSCYPHGTLKGSGELIWEWGREYPLGKIEAILDVALLSWDAKGISFQDAKNVSCHFISDKGVTFRNLHTSLIDPDLKNAYAAIQVEKMEYEFASGELAFDHFYFGVPAHHLPRFSDQMRKSFPSFFSPVFAEVMSNAKLEGKMEGTFSFEMTPPYSAFKLVLKEGRYHFLNAEHDLREFVIESDPFEFKVVSRYFLGDRWVWLYGRSFSPTLEKGELILTEVGPDKAFYDREQETLYIKWENDPQFGLSIHSVDGSYQGFTVQFEKDPTARISDTEMVLMGSVDVDGRRVKGFFPRIMEQKFADWQIGSGYKLRGQWRFQKKGGEVSDYSDKLHFLGKLEGEQFLFKGYQFDSLMADLEYTPTDVHVRDLLARDLSGELKVDEMDFLRNEGGDWEVKMPNLVVSSFCPSLLREAGMPRPSFRKPLIIKKLVLRDFNGPVSNGAELKGGGELYFTNRSKKLLQNTIFQIPSDLLSRIGLDLSVLTPVVGTIHYEVREGKIYLNKFKDVYSEGKLSKFYLAGSISPSYLDFDGKLHVQVKMRQHNLLFKLAELFTVNIQGELGRPLYSLHKQRGKDIGRRVVQRKSTLPQRGF